MITATKFTTKGYFERLAIETLKMMIDESYSLLAHTTDNSNPDWKGNSVISIGLEVSRVMYKKDGGISRVVSEYFGTGMNPSILEQRLREEDDGKHDIIREGNCIAVGFDYSTQSFLKIIEDRIDEKTKKLCKSNYSLFNSNELFLWLEHSWLLSNKELLQIKKCIFDRSGLKYDCVYLLNQERLYMINKYKIRKIIISKHKMKTIIASAKPYDN